MRELFADYVLYADDVILMSASICKLQDTLDIFYEYRHEIGLMGLTL